jgi:hypothetical protein
MYSEEQHGSCTKIRKYQHGPCSWIREDHDAPHKDKKISAYPLRKEKRRIAWHVFKDKKTSTRPLRKDKGRL